MINLIALLIFSFIFNNCCYLEGPRGSGNIKSQKRDLQAYHSIDLRCAANIYITQDSQKDIRIEAEDNILPLIRTKVRGKTLIIETKDFLGRHEPINIYATMEEIEGLNISGSGKIFGENKIKTREIELEISGSGNIDLGIDAERIYSQITGSGNIIISGNADYHKVKISGSGKIRGHNLITNNYDIKITGSGDCEIYAKNELDVRISGSGDVIYYGDPLQVNSNISGSGKLKKR